MSAPPRVRFAPAPSGWLHVGGARTALFNWLHARGDGGSFVLRVEDTDADRVSEESYRGLLDALRFLGLDWDEGPEIGGPHGPYRQSERIGLHRAVAAALLEAGAVYEAFETPEELEEQRAQQAGRPPVYPAPHRDLTDDERAAFRAEGRAPALRVRTPDEGEVAFDDAVRGRVAFDWRDIGDFVVVRADGSPTYPLANAVDDLSMGITAIARGEDLLSVTPRQLLVYDLLLRDGLLDRALEDAGYGPRPDRDAAVPSFAHLPLLVGADRKPLSKRHGSVAVDEFRRQGFLPEVLVGFLALCGWSPGGDRELLDEAELIAAFSLDRVQRNPAYFDVDKLRSFNGDRIRALEVEDLAQRLEPVLVDAGLVEDPVPPPQRALLAALAPLLQERIQALAEAVPLIGFAFRDEVQHDQAAVRKHLKGVAGTVLDRFADALEHGAVPWDGDALEAWFAELAAELGVGLGKVMQPVRVAVTGTAVSPPLPQTLAALEETVVLARIRAARPLVAEDATA